MSKTASALHGPSWAEVLIGAALSLALGVILAAAHLALKPATTVKELPKEPAAGTVYYLEGSKDSNKGKTWLRKRQAFLDAQSVDLSEEELNTAVATPVEKPKGGAGQPSNAAQPANDSWFTVGNVNFRIAAGELQIGVPVRVNLIDASVVVQTSGSFEKQSDVFNFVPNTLYIGSLPAHRIPLLANWAIKRLLAAQAIPTDLAEAWQKLTGVAIEGKTLKLAMP